MSRFKYTFAIFVTAVFMIVVTAKAADTTLVSQWGKTRLGTAWPIIPNATAGSVGIGDGAVPTAFATIGGQFDTLTATTTQAAVVIGKMEIVGGSSGSAYTWMRYALTFQDSTTLNYAGTDSAMWSSPQGWSGYEFDPITGSGTMSNTFNSWPEGTQGTVWALNNGNFNSTNSNGGPPLSQIKNQPRNAEAIAGTYDFAISVKSINDTVNELSWYLIEQNNAYWFGGTIQTISTTKKFNAINFAFNNDFGGTQVNFTDVKAFLGEPITVPAAPWQAFYVSDWGKTRLGTAWPILWDDSTTIVGNAGIGDGAVPTAFATIGGGFGDPVTISTDKAIIVTGKMEIVGGSSGSAYTWMRYALTFQDSLTLNYKGTDSAMWSSPQGWSGYEFDPITGSGTMSNTFNSWPEGTQGTVWALNNGNFNSTNSNGGPPLSQIKNQPRNAEAIAGTYDFAISVKSINDTVNELSWYLIEQNNAYWFGGTIQTISTTKKFNAINFAFNNDFGGTQVNFTDVKVDLGESITVPEAPFQPYYVDTWGFFGNNMGGWSFTPGELTGNASISGDAPNTEGVALRGEFQTFTPTQNRPLKITGKVDFVGGGFDASSSFRLGVFYTDSAGTLVVDTAAATLPDSTHWTGTDNYSSGYLFIPQSGSNGPVDWNGSQGTYGAVVNTTWLSPNESNNYVLGNNVPNPSTGGEGTYDFEISVTPLGDGTSIVKCNFFNDNLNWVVSTVDNHSPLATDKFNSIAFALDAGNSITALNVTDVQIDSGTITDVDDLENTAIPLQYSLSQNYPNPFNPSTTIEFALPQASKVSLVVYDVLGREVAKLADGNFNAGYQKINFNASNLASGVYFYRLKAGDFVSVKKLMLLK